MEQRGWPSAQLKIIIIEGEPRAISSIALFDFLTVVLGEIAPFHLSLSRHNDPAELTRRLHFICAPNGFRWE